MRFLKSAMRQNSIVTKPDTYMKYLIVSGILLCRKVSSGSQAQEGSGISKGINTAVSISTKSMVNSPFFIGGFLLEHNNLSI